MLCRETFKQRLQVVDAKKTVLFFQGSHTGPSMDGKNPSPIVVPNNLAIPQTFLIFSQQRI
jgi:hypothetical protein